MKKDCGRYEKIHVGLNRVKFEITDFETCIFDHSKEPREKFTAVICSVGNLIKTSEETHTHIITFSLITGTCCVLVLFLLT